jgi:bifunctional ADP-heptose synthase (sugar kinase/adenylyltransferase)
MAGTDREEQLEHDLANVEQEKRALQGMLKKAVQQIGALVESDCDKRVTDEAQQIADKLKRAASL